MHFNIFWPYINITYLPSDNSNIQYLCFTNDTRIKKSTYRTSGNKNYKCFLLWTHHKDKGPRAFVSDNTQSDRDTHLYVYVMYTQVCAYQSFRILPFLRVEKHQHIYKKKSKR